MYKPTQQTAPPHPRKTRAQPQCFAARTAPPHLRKTRAQPNVLQREPPPYSIHSPQTAPPHPRKTRAQPQCFAARTAPIQHPPIFTRKRPLPIFAKRGRSPMFCSANRPHTASAHLHPQTAPPILAKRGRSPMFCSANNACSIYSPQTAPTQPKSVENNGSARNQARSSCSWFWQDCSCDTPLGATGTTQNVSVF